MTVQHIAKTITEMSSLKVIVFLAGFLWFNQVTSWESGTGNDDAATDAAQPATASRPAAAADAKPKQSYVYPFQDPALDWDYRVDDLLGRLTIQEVIEQSMAVYFVQGTPAIPRLNIKPYMWITECEHGAAETNGTAWPVPIALASSFSREAVYNMSVGISYEVRAHWNNNSAHGQYWTYQGLGCFSPVVNIMRHPLWGRNQETWGEDPYLTGQMATQFVHGLQGQHQRYVRVNAGCKHFDSHGGPEAGRFGFDAVVSMQDLQMTFFPAFKQCVEAGSYSIMCSYNAINGTPMCGNRGLLTDTLRYEWGFRGYVVSDAGAVADIMNAHHYTHTKEQTVADAILAGCNLELGRNKMFTSLTSAIQQGLVTDQQVRDSARPLFKTRMKLGLFDPPDMVPYNKVNLSVVQSPAHRSLALRAAMMSLVLLKNDNLLPLTKQYNTVAVLGPMANNSLYQYGNAPPKVNDKYVVTILDGLRQLAPVVQYSPGCTDTKCNDYNHVNVSDAVSGAELVIVCLGLGPKLENEEVDRPDITLPGQQLDLLQDAVYYAQGKPVILLLFNADPLDITWAKYEPGVSVILECHYPGQTGGEAVYNVLTMTGGSESVPAARLVATWPAHTSQVGKIEDYSMQGRTYRYYEREPLYPFGYGLSYSTFSYMSMTVSPNVIETGQSVDVQVSVQNQGPYDAHEVIQVYMSWLDASLPSPKLTLVGYDRVPLKVNETVTRSFVVRADQMKLWMNDNVGFKVNPGKMRIYAGGQQPNQRTKVPSIVLHADFTITDM